MPAVLIREIEPSDLQGLIAVYHDAVISQTQELYTERQIRAWAGHAARSPDLHQALQRGYGLLACNPAATEDHNQTFEAFALLDPADRLSLLYCRGRSSRRGLATRLVTALEAHAAAQGIQRLRTEASQLSRPLLERLGWQVKTEEELIFAGEPFRRWRMERHLG